MTRRGSSAEEEHDFPVGKPAASSEDAGSAAPVLDATPVRRKRGRPPKVRKEGEGAARVPQKRAGASRRVEPAGVPQGTAWDALEHPEKYALPPQGRGYAAQYAQILRSDVPREQTNVRLRSELKRAAQIVAVTRNMSLGDVIEEALIDYLKKHRPQVPEE